MSSDINALSPSLVCLLSRLTFWCVLPLSLPINQQRKDWIESKSVLLEVSYLKRIIMNVEYWACMKCIAGTHAQLIGFGLIPTRSQFERHIQLYPNKSNNEPNSGASHLRLSLTHKLWWWLLAVCLLSQNGSPDRSSGIRHAPFLLLSTDIVFCSI